VCVPVAILHEDIEMIENTVRLLKKGQEFTGKPVEVILWFNAKYEESKKDVVEQKAGQLYQAIRNKLLPFEGKDFRIITALQTLPEDYASISQVRSDYMDAVTVGAVKRGYSFEHPIIWLDVDTNYMSPNTLKDLSSGVRNFEALMLHANLRFSIDWANGKKMKELDPATKAVIVREMQRRNHFKYDVEGANYHGARGLAYVEESGLAFALGTYLQTYGVDTNHGMSESAYLKRQTDAMWKDETTYHLMERSGVDMSQYLVPIPKFLWDRLVTNANKNNGSVGIRYIESARVSTSARRNYELARQAGAGGLVDPEQDGYLIVGLASDTKPVDESAEISASDVKGMMDQSQALLEQRAALQGSDQKSQEQEWQEGLRRQIDKYFGE